MYHFDAPQPLQDLGGLVNRSFVDWFSDYSRILFKHFGDDVKQWITFNEGKFVCKLGYGSGYLAPGIVGEGREEYICGHNIIKAHAKAWHIYDEEFRATQKGKCLF